MATANTFSFGEALREGWRLTKANGGLILGVMGFSGLMQLMPGIISGQVQNAFHVSKETDLPADINVVMAVVNLVFTLFGFYINCGFLIVLLKLVESKPVVFGDLFPPVKRAIIYFVTVIVYGLIVLGGTLFLIIPGIVFSLKYRFASLATLDQNVGPGEALRLSSRITKGVKTKLLLFSFFMGLVNLGGLLLFGVGLLATLPATSLADVWVYRKLLSQTEIQPAQ